MKKYNDSPRAQTRRVMSGGTPYKRRRKKAPLRKSKDERKQEYGAYLQSDRWKEKRDRIIKKAGGKCRFCGKPATAVHHETYKRRGREKDVDLTAVCDHCHAMLHRKYGEAKGRQK